MERVKKYEYEMSKLKSLILECDDSFYKYFNKISIDDPRLQLTTVSNLLIQIIEIIMFSTLSIRYSTRLDPSCPVIPVINIFFVSL